MTLASVREARALREAFHERLCSLWSTPRFLFVELLSDRGGEGEDGGESEGEGEDGPRLAQAQRIRDLLLLQGRLRRDEPRGAAGSPPPGLQLLEEFCSAREEHLLLQQLNAYQGWTTVKGRHVVCATRWGGRGHGRRHHHHHHHHHYPANHIASIWTLARLHAV